MILNRIFLCFVGISTYIVCSTVANEAIVGGDEAADGQFPYQVALIQGGIDICGGGIIDEKLIITAAHCIIRHDGEFNNNNLYILAGTKNLKRKKLPAVTVKVKKIYVPREYNITDVDTLADIAVLKLEHPLQLSKHIQVLDLPKDNSQTFTSKTAMIAGYGWNWVYEKDRKEMGYNTDDHLRFAEVDVRGRCNTYYFKNLVSEKEICARVKQRQSYERRGVCTGDSGSPLVYNNIAIGILFGSLPGCSEKNTGALYTRVSAYLDFLHKAMRDQKSRSIRTFILP